MCNCVIDHPPAKGNADRERCRVTFETRILCGMKTGMSGIRFRGSCLQPRSRGLMLCKRLSAKDLCRAATRPHRSLGLRLLARGRLVCALLLASTPEVDPIHLGSTSQQQSSNTVVTRQVPGVTTGLRKRRAGSGTTEGSRHPKTTGTQGGADGTPRNLFAPRTANYAPPG